jgi:BON domain
MPDPRPHDRARPATAGSTIWARVHRSGRAGLWLAALVCFAALAGCAATVAQLEPVPEPVAAAEPSPPAPAPAPTPAPTPEPTPPPKVAPTPDPEQAIDDELIETRILLKIASTPGLELYAVEVEVSRGQVVLTGKVGNAEARQRIVALARQTDGVRRVISKLE